MRSRATTLGTVFTCPDCPAAPEPLTPLFAIIRHDATCPALQQRIRDRWAPPQPERLPATPPPARYDKRRQRLSRGAIVG